MLGLKVDCGRPYKFQDKICIERVDADHVKAWIEKADGTKMYFKNWEDKSIWMGKYCTLIITGVEVEVSVVS